MMVSNAEKIALRNIEKRNKIRIKQIDEDGMEVEREEERPTGSRRTGRERGQFNRFERRRKPGIARRGEMEQRTYGQGNPS